MIQLTNDYSRQVFNGDIGRVTAVWREGRTLRFSVAFSGRAGASGGAASGGAASGGAAAGGAAAGGAVAGEAEVEYTRSALDKDVALSYALTVHKAQGSEYPVVVMPVLPAHAAMLGRNLLYTGLSRAKSLLVLVGTEESLRAAVASTSQGRRRTMLAQRIHDKSFAPPVTRHMSD